MAAHRRPLTVLLLLSAALTGCAALGIDVPARVQITHRPDGAGEGRLTLRTSGWVAALGSQLQGVPGLDAGLQQGGWRREAPVHRGTFTDFPFVTTDLQNLGRTAAGVLFFDRYDLQRQVGPLRTRYSLSGRLAGAGSLAASFEHLTVAITLPGQITSANATSWRDDTATWEAGAGQALTAGSEAANFGETLLAYSFDGRQARVSLQLSQPRLAGADLNAALGAALPAGWSGSNRADGATVLEHGVPVAASGSAPLDGVDFGRGLGIAPAGGGRYSFTLSVPRQHWERVCPAGTLCRVRVTLPGEITAGNGLIIEGGTATWEIRPERMAPQGFVLRAESAPHANALLKRLRAWKNGLIENSVALSTMQTPDPGTKLAVKVAGSGIKVLQGADEVVYGYETNDTRGKLQGYTDVGIGVAGGTFAAVGGLIALGLLTAPVWGAVAVSAGVLTVGLMVTRRILE